MLRASIPLRPCSVSGYGGMAVTPHHLATVAAVATLERGGNAVDAAITANAVQGMVAPETCGIGGDLFALVTGPGIEGVLALNASGRAGSGAGKLARELRTSGAKEIPQRHPAAASTPGCVDGWLALHARLGRLDFDALLQPAIRLGRDGFAASRELAAAFARRFDELREEVAFSDIYATGRPPLEGERIRRSRLAATLERIAGEGRAAVYAGELGSAISAAVDGAITTDDLAVSQAEWVEPLAAEVFGAKVWTVPPNSQGYITLAALAVQETLGLPDPGDPLAWHLAIESYRQAAADRDQVVADSASMSLQPATLVSPDRIQEMAARISAERAVDVPPPPPADGGTAFMCVADDEGLGISLIQSNFYGIGSGISVSGGGFVLQDRGRGFTLHDGHPNELAPGRRPLHTLAPTLWTRDGKLAALIGTRGGHIQPQLVSQLSSLILGRDVEPGRAMVAPRWSVPVPGTNGSGSSVRVEPGTPEGVIEGLIKRGHSVEHLDFPQPGWGPMSAITVSSEGLRVGAADPRVDTTLAAAT
jgi:gamma-glutamyltranspeptidase / glutathione hydrolase